MANARTERPWRFARSVRRLNRAPQMRVPRRANASSRPRDQHNFWHGICPPESPRHQCPSRDKVARVDPTSRLPRLNTTSGRTAFQRSGYRTRLIKYSLYAIPLNGKMTFGWDSMCWPAPSIRVIGHAQPVQKEQPEEPLPANTHFNDGRPFRRMNRMKIVAACNAAMLNSITGAQNQAPEKPSTG